MNSYLLSENGGYYYYPSTDGSQFIPNKYISIEDFVIKRDLKETEKIYGISYGYDAKRGEIRSPQGIESQNRLYSLNNNWVCLTIPNYQESYSSTNIFSDYLKTPTDRDIEFFVNKAHQNKVKVCLKPVLDTKDGIWRGHIGFPDLKNNDLDYLWKEWFKNYTSFILHYAELANELKCEIFCIGCELRSTEHREKDWLKVIGEVRKIYNGKIVYQTSHGCEDIQSWFDKLDYIGISAYYTITNDESEALKDWQEIKWRLDAIAEERGKQFLFMEIGCPSVVNSTYEPYTYFTDRKWDENSQSLYYKTCLETFIDDENFAGLFVWNWSTYIYDSIDKAKSQNKIFDIYMKKAEETIKQYYTNKR